MTRTNENCPPTCRCAECRLAKATRLIRETTERLSAIHKLVGPEDGSFHTEECLLAHRLVLDAERFLCDFLDYDCSMAEAHAVGGAASEVRQ